MKIDEPLKTIYINTETKVCEVNGKDRAKDVSAFHLSFENGTWSLEITEDIRFSQ